MGVFYLKLNDTRPVLEVALKNADGSAHDLTGASVKLLIKLNNGTFLSRTMAVAGNPTDGVAQYPWLPTDWDTGNLIVGPTPPFTPDDVDHIMEYEVTNGSSIQTFPNNGYDTLRIFTDLG